MNDRLEELRKEAQLDPLPSQAFKSNSDDSIDMTKYTQRSDADVDGKGLSISDNIVVFRFITRLI